ncbi:nitroreductase family deazaflavin-dependent oxidoreductase [Myxococcota bacterium]|nr:nitroreductase family deazaflavin-dependent oxidoreductase [Myxococcota bacterium]
MAAMKRTRVVEWFWKIHPFIYRISGGRLLGEMIGMPVLLLSTTGARTRSRRTTALTYLPHGGAYVVIGSFLGEPRHPGWVHNLRARPRAEIQVRGRTIAVAAREAQDVERDEIWSSLLAQEPSYRDYAERTEREIPVVVLEPEGDSPSSSRSVS